jgi:SAM-dependent MidA family methyltransferase
MKTPAVATPLARILADRIHRDGPIPFAEFMRECLYHSEFGYYNRKESQRFTDFYTSVDVHPIFGRLLARQLAEMWEALGRPAEFWAVEVAAGTGRLASQVLDFAARELGSFYEALRYFAVEQSTARRGEHAAILAAHVSRGRGISAAELPLEIPAGCIFSNELLDALPVHRVIVRNGALQEVYVASAGEELVEKLGPLSTGTLESYFREQGVTLREGQQAEVGLEACRWIVEAGKRLGRGFVLTVDYGREAAELYDERHMRGTLLAYSQHRATEEFLRVPGEQDLTAHVNFTALDLWGRRAGLTRSGCVSQMQFLVALGEANEFADLYEPGAGEVERIRSRLLLKTLIHPEGMGETFYVFVQQKGVAQARLTPFCVSAPGDRL